MDPEIIKKITGFNKAESVTIDNNKYYRLAYCFRNGKTISPWFIVEGTFDHCYGSYLSIYEISEYNTKYLGIVAIVYVVLYELDNYNNPVKVINEATYRNPYEKHNKYLKDILQISKKLKPLS